MRATIVAVLGAWLAGCAQLAGIDNTSGPDASTGAVSLSFERLSVGATNVTAPQDLSGSHATFLVPDDAEPTGLARVPAALSGSDTWSAVLRAPTAVVFDLPEYPAPIPRIFDFPNPTVTGHFAVMEHPNPQPAPADATIEVKLTLDAPYAGEALQLYSVGAWNIRGLPAPAVGATRLDVLPFAYTSMTSITGRPHERITAQDGVVALRYVSNQLVGALAVPPFDQTGTDKIEGTLSTVLANNTLDVHIDQAAAASRFAACRPGVGNMTMNWSLRAAPGAQFGNDNGPLLNAGVVAMADPPTITASYGNPFGPRGWAPTFTWAVTASRVYTPPSANLPVTLFAQLFQRALPAPGLSLGLPAGLPELVTVDGKPLSSDGQTIARPTKAVDVSFATDVPANTLYQVQMFELVPNMANTALEFKQVAVAMGAAPRFRFPPEVIKPGLYTLRVSTVQGGYPAIADGDLTVRALPVAVGLLDSGVFQVLP